MHRTNVLTIGSLNVDLVAVTQRIPEVGETIRARDFHTFPGGKGANQAVAAAKLGARVTHVGCVGRDDFGELLLSSLRDAGVETKYIQTVDSVSTGMALITVNTEGDNVIVVVSGANERCTPELAERALRETRADVLVMQLEIPMETVIASARAAKRNGMTVILNSAPAEELPSELFSNIDIMVMNESEAEVLTGISVTAAESACAASKHILDKGVRSVVVTLGSEGAVYVSRADSIRVPSFTVQAVDTTAAGDAFVGGLAAILGTTGDIEYTLRFSAAAGALTVTRYGAQSSLPTRKEVEEFMSAVDA